MTIEEPIRPPPSPISDAKVTAMDGKHQGRRRVLLYELNEVPWEVVDMYVRRRPSSNLAGLLERSRCQTTVNEDPNHLSPWRTWPTFHKALYSEEHRSFDLGQDPSTFRGLNVWDIAEANGLTLGLFGPLQSWPPHQPRNGGFYVPDTFSRGPETYPESLRRFQQFNLAMTRRLGFSSDAALSPTDLVLTGLDLMRRGMTPWSAGWICRQLVRERREPRYKACRSIAQALPAFDLFWRLYAKSKPDLSVFFTNHVAGMMHRFWGDAMNEYAEEHEYAADDVFARFIDDAMNVFDHQLGRILRRLAEEPETVLVIASSMGQGGIPYSHIGETFVLTDPQRLAQSLRLGSFTEGIAMYPASAVEFPDEASARSAAAVLRTVEGAAGQLFDEVRVEGRTVTFTIQVPYGKVEVDRSAHYRPNGSAELVTGHLDDLGIAVSERLGGGNTAYHIPEGILITFGEGIEGDSSRTEVNILDAAPMILELLGLEDKVDSLTIDPDRTVV